MGTAPVNDFSSCLFPTFRGELFPALKQQQLGWALLERWVRWWWLVGGGAVASRQPGLP